MYTLLMLTRSDTFIRFHVKGLAKAYNIATNFSDMVTTGYAIYDENQRLILSVRCL